MIWPRSRDENKRPELFSTSRNIFVAIGMQIGLDRMTSCELAAACLLGIVDYVASHAEPHVEHEGINRKQEAGHGSQV